MGCFYSTSKLTETKDVSDDPPKAYSWDKRDKVDPKDYTIENLTGQVIGRLPGTINGQQFIIQNCQDCSIYLFDQLATVSIDDCVNCRIFIGPVKTSGPVRKWVIHIRQLKIHGLVISIRCQSDVKFDSVFIRDCNECRFAVACQQFRTRDCKQLDVFLSCVTQPIIEASTSVRFGCLQYSYPQLEAQYGAAGLSLYNNNWSSTHDFTPVPGEENFSFLPRDADVADYIPIPNSPEFVDMAISTESSQSVVPLTLGRRRCDTNESCLVVFFDGDASAGKTKAFVHAMRDTQVSCHLVQSKEVKMEPNDALRVFHTEDYHEAVLKGPVIGLEYSGPDCCEACRRVLVASPEGASVFMSASSGEASQQVEDFYNFADMQMAM